MIILMQNLCGMVFSRPSATPFFVTFGQFE